MRTIDSAVLTAGIDIKTPDGEKVFDARLAYFGAEDDLAMLARRMRILLRIPRSQPTITVEDLDEARERINTQPRTTIGNGLLRDTLPKYLEAERKMAVADSVLAKIDPFRIARKG